MRDVTLETTFYHAFTTRAFATGIPGTLGGSPVLSVLEGGNATPITDGVSVSVDRAGVAGLNEATIVATAANGYEAGKTYAIYISTGTVDGVSVVGEVVGEFTIEQSAAFDRLGAPAGASVSADIANVPTVSEFNARTLAAADYFDPAADTVANVTAVSTVTNLTNLPSIPAGWLTAAGIAASALDGKGDWNIGKAGYSISGTKTTLDALNDVAATDIVSSGAITTLAGAVVNVDLVDTCTSNTDMRGTDGSNTTVPPSAAAIASEVLTSQMTESYAANGVAPTLAQAQFAIHQMLMQFGISGTSLTVRKLNDVTTAFVVTLNSDTAPTDAKRV